MDSITLSWSQPDQPNGVILDYELQYYEKVPELLAPSHPHLPEGASQAKGVGAWGPTVLQDETRP